MPPKPAISPTRQACCLLLRKRPDDLLAGRFELMRAPHWSFGGCREMLGFLLNDSLPFGGFPSAACFAGSEQRLDLIHDRIGAHQAEVLR